MKLFSDSITSLERGLDYAALQQKTIANNIANADTPNYKSQEASFKNVFSDAVSALQANRTDIRHFQFDDPQNKNILIKRNMSYNENGNSVDIDKEMSDLATNQLYYNALADRLSSKFSSLTNVIKGGR
ncbi:flagellar basal body rod protein FlgB [Domibacillus antri]|uniref:Flagellar basal body rod protein FlgB n=1 Tax=Domibacillus antri TaxID=1714264 RepID=A0A1Q8Q677_9BACI|nr:flagellar basal body rod protein FlgB [Domibacillus antri]OLN22795.1 flagellar basal body rod protein FlgB [Domibacillus antri]